MSKLQHHCKKHEQITTPLQEAYSFWASYSNIAKSIYFL